MSLLDSASHRRLNQLTGEWVLVSPHRTSRPWQGEIEKLREAERPRYDPSCYLCPGNERVSRARNPEYKGTYVFDNDLPCVSFDAPASPPEPAGIYRNRPAHGVARVVCYSPRHSLTLAELEPFEVEALLRAWQEQYVELGGRPEIKHVLTFENKGEAVGCSNPHPHCQIYATNFVYKFIETEARVSEQHLAETGRILFQDILEAEKLDGRRIICENDSAIAFMPYFARYAYEVFVAPKATHPSIASLSGPELRDFAAVLRELVIRYDNLWGIPFPYVMPLHQAPTDGAAYPGFHFHVEFHPPLRRPNLLKYLAGPEIGGGNFLSDTSPEEKAAELRAVSPVHYAMRRV